MSEITKLEIWRDTGFTEGDVEVPKISSLTLSNPDFTIESGLFPSKDRLFGSVKLEGEWLELYDTSYLRATFEFNNTRAVGNDTQNTIILYGWVDSVALVSDNNDRPMTQIIWHIDYWRTFAGMAHYGYGMVTRRPRGEDDPIQSVPYRYRLAGERQYLEPSDGVYWAGVVYAHKESDTHPISSVRTLWCPFDRNSIEGNISFKTSNSSILKSPSLSDLVNGKLDERLGIDPSSVSYAFVSPFAPFEYEWKYDSQTSQHYIEFATQPTGQEIVWGPVSQEIAYTGTYVTSIETKMSQLVGKQYNFHYSNGTESGWKNIGQLSSIVNDSYNGHYDVQNVKYGDDQSSGAHFSIKLKDIFIQTLGQAKWNSFGNDSRIIVSRTVPGVTAWSSRQRNIASGTPYIVTDTFTGQLGSGTFTKAECENGVWLSTADKDLLAIRTQEPTMVTLYSLETFNQSGKTCGAVFTNSSHYSTHSLTFNPVKTTDTSECVITDLSANAVGTLPWGREFSSCDIRVVNDSMNAYAELRFEGIDGKLNGTTYSIPLPHIDITTNAWSSYNYSGQREYDIRQREIARNQAFMSGVAGAITGSASNALLGYLGGERGESKMQYTARAKAYLNEKYPKDYLFQSAFGPNVLSNWMQANPRVENSKGSMAGLGLAGSIAGGVAGSALEWGVQGIFNNQLQKSSDALTAKQSESIASFGNGWDWLWYGEKISLVTLVPDNYSLSRYATDVALNGIIVSEPMSDTDTLIKSSEGPLQVTGTIVTGSIPVQAKYALQNKLASGVRLV